MRLDNLFVFPELDSSNAYCKRNLASLCHMAIVQCYFQTDGQGRMDHIWHSQKGKDMLLSIVLKPCINIQHIQQLNQVVAVSLLDVLQSHNISAMIKWPNDIMVKDEKIAGILIESCITDHLEGIIVGVGLNVNNEQYVSISKCIDREISIEIIRDQFLQAFVRRYKQYEKGEYARLLQIANTYSYLRDKWIGYKQEEVRFIELLDNGMLVVEKKEGNRHTLCINEVSLHQKEGSL